ncbi:MAG: methyltransferase domain-containing protein [Bacteroidaceae bacterium]|nr:methyltransferase domain-containing protein [Bacteroidaceae bacterium]
MQERQNNRSQYFDELVTTCEKYFIPYISQFLTLHPGLSVLEIGCGDGGNLLPFSQRGCKTIGVDLSPSRIKVAQEKFHESEANGQFIASDIFEMKELEHQFGLIICHDVLEHISDKADFLRHIRDYLTERGKVFMSFPAWQMPFGGHQQICQNRLLSHLPFFHLLPYSLYKTVLRMAKEPEATINELLSIKKTRCPIELFERLAQQEGFHIEHRQLYFINPHYETKFHLRPRKLWSALSHIPWLRNFFTTSCFYIMEVAH